MRCLLLSASWRYTRWQFASNCSPLLDPLAFLDFYSHSHDTACANFTTLSLYTSLNRNTEFAHYAFNHASSSPIPAAPCSTFCSFDSHHRSTSLRCTIFAIHFDPLSLSASCRTTNTIFVRDKRLQNFLHRRNALATLASLRRSSF